MTDNLPAVFDFRGYDVRVLKDERGTDWWVLKDVCHVLGIAQPVRVAESLDDDEVTTTHVIDSLGRNQQTYVVSEGGLFSLIARSRKPEAKAFRRWVNHEVLPAIRHTGAYLTPATLADPANLIQMLQNWQADRERADRAEVVAAKARKELEAVKPDADSWKGFVDKAKGDMSVADAAKHLCRAGIDTGQNRLFDWLMDHGWIYRVPFEYGQSGYKPKQDRVGRGYLSYRVKPVERGDRQTFHHEIRVTPSGLDLLRRRMLASKTPPLFDDED